MTGCWAGVPADRVVHLRGAGESAVELALRVQPADGPASAVVGDRPQNSPVFVPTAVQRVQTSSSSAHWSSTRRARSGKPAR